MQTFVAVPVPLRNLLDAVAVLVNAHIASATKHNFIVLLHLKQSRQVVRDDQ